MPCVKCGSTDTVQYYSKETRRGGLYCVTCRHDERSPPKCYWCGSVLVPIARLVQVPKIKGIDDDELSLCPRCKDQIPHTMKVKHIINRIILVKRELKEILETGNKTAENHQKIKTLRKRIARMENIEVKPLGK
jgi:hypothetical protein